MLSATVESTGRGRTLRRGTRSQRRSRTPAGPPAMTVPRVLRAANELKNLDTTGSGALSGTAYNLYPLNNITQGATGNTRTGRMVMAEAIRIGLILTLNSANIYDFVRIIVVFDKECRGSSLGSSDILTSNSFGTEQIISSYNFDNVPSRCNILHDEVVPLHHFVATNATNTAWAGGIFSRVFHVPVKRRVHYYNTSAGTIADIDSGSLSLFVMGSSGSNESTLSLDVRHTFRDL